MAHFRSFEFGTHLVNPGCICCLLLDLVRLRCHAGIDDPGLGPPLSFQDLVHDCFQVAGEDKVLHVGPDYRHTVALRSQFYIIPDSIGDLVAVNEYRFQVATYAEQSAEQVVGYKGSNLKEE